jgi:hypothetical protein
LINCYYFPSDGDEICLSLCLPGQTISNGVNGTNNNTSTPNGGSPDLNGIRKSVGSATEGGLSPQTTLVLQSNGAPGPQYVDTELLRQTLKSINKRMERIETKLEYKNNHFDLAAKDLRLLLASLKSRPGEQTNRSAGLETDINKEIFLKLRFTLEGHTGPVNSLAQRDGLLYSGSDDNTIQVRSYIDYFINYSRLIRGILIPLQSCTVQKIGIIYSGIYLRFN